MYPFLSLLDLYNLMLPLGLIASPNIVDGLAVLAMLWGLYRGLRRGLSGELGQLIGVIAALVFGLNAYRPVSAWLLGATRLTGRSAVVIAFLVTLAAALVVWILLRALFRRLMRVVIEARFDHGLGLAAGFVRSALLVVIVFAIMNLWPNATLNRIFGEDSFVGTLVLKLVPQLREDGN